MYHCASGYLRDITMICPLLSDFAIYSNWYVWKCTLPQTKSTLMTEQNYIYIIYFCYPQKSTNVLDFSLEVYETKLKYTVHDWLAWLDPSQRLILCVTTPCQEIIAWERTIALGSSDAVPACIAPRHPWERIVLKWCVSCKYHVKLALSWVQTRRQMETITISPCIRGLTCSRSS